MVVWRTSAPLLLTNSRLGLKRSMPDEIEQQDDHRLEGGVEHPAPARASPRRSPSCAPGGHGHPPGLHSYSNPKGNADTERFLRTLKEGLVCCANGPARPPSSPPSIARSPTTTTAISTRPSATASP